MTSTYRDIQNFLSPEFVLQSRIHPLNRLFASGAMVHIKREDELSSGIAGSKYRKFASLIPYFLTEGFDEIVIIGGAQSNNIVAALQLLNENRIPAKLFLLQSNDQQPRGNLLWISLLHDLKDINWITREAWKNVNELAYAYRQQELKYCKRVFVLEEGGAVTEAIPGAMSLAADIAKNEKDNNIQFDHIFIDSGSGLSAIGLLAGLQLIEKSPMVHITLIAGTETEFKANYVKIIGAFQQLSQLHLPDITWQNIRFYEPHTGKSFGAVNKTVLETIKYIARTEGILMDPVYSVKHFITAMETIDNQCLTGNALFIYNGGSFALSGFTEKIIAG